MKRKAYNRKRRNVELRKRKSITYIVAEGKNKTETLYFKAFGHDTNKIIRFAKGNHTDPVNMISELRNLLNDNDFSAELGDKAYCLIDADFSPSKNSQILKADELARNYGAQVIVSAPCFEYWFLCHYKASGKKYKSSIELISDLEKQISEYSKNAPNMYELLKEKTESAIKNAKTMELTHVANGEKIHTVDFSPSTEVYYIAEDLIK